MKVLVINSGSSSIKYQLLEMDTQTVIAAGLVERIGEANSRIKHTIFNGGDNEIIKEGAIANHQDGLKMVADLLMDADVGVISSPTDINAVGHRTVHGGETFNKTVVITQAVKDKIRELSPLAPLHNPPNLEGIEVAEAIFPHAPQVGVFDTAYHQTMPPRAYRYAIPNELYEQHAVRSYGFHGTSHLYVSKLAAQHLGKPHHETNVITIHLGNGASMAAIQNGQSIDTTMGFGPMPGLMMGTRCGDIDPAVIFFMGGKLEMPLSEIDRTLNKKSGLVGVCGNNDLRDVEKRRSEGDEQAQLALDIYTYRIKKYIGAYMAALGAVDALVFTAGVGENSDYVRWHACEGLANLGIVLDAEQNAIRAKTVREIQAAESRIKVLVIPTNEELEIATQTVAVLKENGLA